MARGKRSIKESKATKNNSTIQFYEAVDEINEDTLKNSSKSGTINIKKIDVRKQQISRRTAVADNNNSSLNINHNPKLYDTHIADNKLETNHSVEQFDALGHEKLHQISGNISVQIKNKDLSKLVVNELKSGTEYIGDTHAPVMSNITFKSENDTLTAMTFIAGNLLNKLWNMEKDSNGESIETEILKHEKIADLLELFREPLSLRQENFLKNALEHLSNAVNNKDVNNVSLCANIVEATRLLKETSKDIDNDVKSTEEDILRQDIDNNKNVEDHFKTATTEAVSKINNVLSLMKKFEGIQKTLGDLRTVNKSDIEKTEQIDPLTRDENSVLSVYGNVLEKITKLIMPDKNSKRFSNKIGNINLQEVKRKLKDSYNIDVGNTNMTAKDKLVVEYINHIENNPGCLLKDKRYNINAKPIPKVEGILLNLSEFFKIKSFTDLLKMLEPEKSNLRVTVDTTIKPVRTTTITTTESANIAADQKKFASTKEKLKAHLKIIVEDLIEMQNVSGLLSNGSDISLADVLPCIYNILNDISLKGNNPTELERITAIFKSIKEAMNMPETRRSSIVTEGRPKSVVVWERVINNLDKKQKLKTRRTFDTKLPKSYEELKKMMDRIESYGSNTYKNVPFFTEVPPADKLVLLKTLDADSKRYIKVLEDIKISMDTITDLSLQKRKDIDEFVENADRNIKLNEKVVKALNNKKINNLGVDGKKQLVKAKPKAKPSFKLSEAAPSLNTYETNNKMKVVTRDEIIQQLIKNRMLIYINMKETKGGETNDVNYEIAKKILMYLENGNYRIAREMYKFFVSRKQISSAETSDRFRVPTYGSENLSQSVQFQKQPLVQFEETKLNNQIKQVATQDHLLKQLLNIKNMSI